MKKSPDGIYSQPGRVWALARNMPDMKKDDTPGLKAYYNDVVRGMTQKITVEVAGVEGYKKALARLGMKMPFPVPEPVSGPQ